MTINNLILYYIWPMIFSLSRFILLTRTIILFMMLMSSAVFGQFKYETLSTVQGLSQGRISDIIQCRDGFLWITTQAGLNRYDGYSFKVYNHDAFDPYSISSNATLFLNEDSKGRIWVGSEHGLNIFDKKTERFYRLYHDAKNPNSLSGNLSEIRNTELADGRFLISTSPTILDIITLPDDFFENEKAIIIEHINKPKTSINYENSKNEITYTDSKNITWYINYNYLYRFNEKTFQFELQKKEYLWRHNIIKNKDGSVWFNDEYISLFDGMNSYPTFTKPLVNSYLPPILKEDNGRLWMGRSKMNGSLEVYDVSKWQKGKPIDDEKSLVFSDHNVFVLKIFKDISGLIWIGQNGHGLRKYSLDYEKFNHIAPKKSIRKIISGSQNNLYLHTWHEILTIDLKGKIKDHKMVPSKAHFISFFTSKTGDLWLTEIMDISSKTIVSLQQINLTTKERKTYKVDFKGRYPHVQNIIEDQDGLIWIGGLNGFYAVFDPKTGNFKEFNIKNFMEKNLVKIFIIRRCIMTSWVLYGWVHKMGLQKWRVRTF